MSQDAFRTRRLLLQPMEMTDGKRLFPLFSDPRIWWYAPEDRHRVEAQTTDYATRAAARWDVDGLSYWVAVLLGDPQQLVGTGGVQRRDDGTWNLNYRISPMFQRRGFASELGSAGIQAARRRDPVNPVLAWIDELNVQSIATAKAIGMTRVGARLDKKDGRIRIVFTDRGSTGRE